MGARAGSVLIAMLSLAVAACGMLREPPDPVVDGWPIGAVSVCDPSARCPELLAVAIEGLAKRDPGHAEIVSQAIHDEGTTMDADGNRILHTRSGQCCRVVVFTLADGTVRAIGAGFPGVSDVPIAVDYGP